VSALPPSMLSTFVAATAAINSAMSFGEYERKAVVASGVVLSALLINGGLTCAPASTAPSLARSATVIITFAAVSVICSAE